MWSGWLVWGTSLLGSEDVKQVAANVNVPEPMDRPRIVGAGDGIGIPELRLEDLAPGVDRAAGIDGSGVVAAQRPVRIARS